MNLLWWWLIRVDGLTGISSDDVVDYKFSSLFSLISFGTRNNIFCAKHWWEKQEALKGIYYHWIAVRKGEIEIFFFSKAHVAILNRHAK